VVAVRTLGGEAIEDPKAFGYRSPFEVECRVEADREQRAPPPADAPFRRIGGYA
jgi:hypothetical protein